MALHHAAPGEIVEIGPLGDRLADAINVTLLRSENIQVFRVVLRKGEEFSDHAVPGEITVQCIEGLVDFSCHDKVQQLAPGQLLYLNGGEVHALKALEDASVLVTIYHPRHPDPEYKKEGHTDGQFLRTHSLRRLSRDCPAAGPC